MVLTKRSDTRFSRGDRVLLGIERVGNKIPEAFILLCGLFLFLGVLSTILAVLDVEVQVPGAPERTVVRGLFTVGGITWFTTSVVPNFIAFPPLGVTVTILLAVGLAASTGMLTAAIKASFSNAPRWTLPYAVTAVCMVGHIMADAVMLVVPPLAAMVFKAAGRHPVAGPARLLRRRRRGLQHVVHRDQPGRPAVRDHPELGRGPAGPRHAGDPV